MKIGKKKCQVAKKFLHVVVNSTMKWLSVESDVLIVLICTEKSQQNKQDIQCHDCDDAQIGQEDRVKRLDPCTEPTDHTMCNAKSTKIQEANQLLGLLVIQTPGFVFSQFLIVGWLAFVIKTVVWPCGTICIAGRYYMHGYMHSHACMNPNHTTCIAIWQLMHKLQLCCS